MQKSEPDKVEKPQQPLVFFDLETTGLSQSCEIVQLAAVSGGHSLNLYVIPRGRMQRGATKVTGFKVRRQRLYLHRQLVLTNSLREVLVSFIAFLQMLGRPLVIGHNIRRFDCPLLARALDELDLRAEFESSVSGCVDTLPLAREMLKDRGLQSFRQENLVRELLGVNYKAHDALEDVRALQALYSVLQPTPELICRHRFTLDTMENKPDVKSKAPCKLPEQQRPLWEHFSQTVKVTESKAEGHEEELNELQNSSHQLIKSD
ncbi:protein PML-like [Symphorus nematophorus]